MTLTRRDFWGGAVVAGSLAVLLAYRAAFVEPRAWGAVCAAAAAPLACLPRAALLWLQYQGFWGGGALLTGLLALMSGRFSLAVAALAGGLAGVVNYNATFGMLGAALGAWTWLSTAAPSRFPRI